MRLRLICLVAACWSGTACRSPLPYCATDQECVALAKGAPAYCDQTIRHCFLANLDDGGFDSGAVDSGSDAGLDAGDGGSSDAGPDAGVADGGTLDGGSDAGAGDGGSDAGIADAGCDCPAQTWTLTGAQDAGTQFTNVIALDDGRVLVSGGDLLTRATLRFHPNSGTWSNGGTMLGDHSGAPLARLPMGRVLVSGGFRFPNSEATAEVFDSTTNQWSSTGSLVNARAAHNSTALLDGRVLISGGSDGVALVPWAEVFDPLSKSFSETGQMIVPREGHTSTLLLDGRVLVASGSNEVGSRAAEIFSPDSGSWTAAGTLNSPGNYHRAILLGNGNVLLFADEWGAEIFDPDAGTWTPAGPLLNPPSVPGSKGISGLPDGGVIVCGGRPSSAECEVYSAALNSWSRTGQMQRPRSRPQLVLMKSGKVLGVGGTEVFADGGVGPKVLESEIFW
jgi:hypothetical protein